LKIYFAFMAAWAT